MACRLPEGIAVLERGWLSANNVLLADGSEVVLVDSGYVSHAAQTVALLEQALAGRALVRLVNTHSHSDHIGGNAAVQARFGCPIHVPAGMFEAVQAWDEEALLLSPAAQHGERFRADGQIRAGEWVELGGRRWQALPAPGHDASALVFFAPDEGLLISGDALWEQGFGIIFAELVGLPGGLQDTRATLDRLAALPLRLVIPGHGSPFEDVDAALDNAYRRLAAFEQSGERLARHALKALFVYSLLEARRMSREAVERYMGEVPLFVAANRRFLGDLPPQRLAELLLGELLKAGVIEAVVHDGVHCLQPA